MMKKETLKSKATIKMIVAALLYLGLSFITMAFGMIGAYELDPDDPNF